MSRISTRFKSRHQEMDNASYLDMPQTTAGVRPLARRERQPKGLGGARSSLQTQHLQRQLQGPKTPRAFPERHCRELLFTEPEPAASTGYYGTRRVKVEVVFTGHHTLQQETGVSTRQGHEQWDTDSTRGAEDTWEGDPECQGWVSAVGSDGRWNPADCKHTAWCPTCGVLQARGKRKMSGK